MNKQQFQQYLKAKTQDEHLKKNNWKYGLTAFWIKQLAYDAEWEVGIKPSIARIISIKYFNEHPQTAYDHVLNHGSGETARVVKMLQEEYPRSIKRILYLINHDELVM